MILVSVVFTYKKQEQEKNHFHNLDNILNIYYIILETNNKGANERANQADLHIKHVLS